MRLKESQEEIIKMIKFYKRVVCLFVCFLSRIALCIFRCFKELNKAALVRFTGDTAAKNRQFIKFILVGTSKKNLFFPIFFFFGPIEMKSSKKFCKVLY